MFSIAAFQAVDPGSIPGRRIESFKTILRSFRNKDKKTFRGPGVLICSIDNMPTQLPMEATDFFGDLLLPHVPNILMSDANKVKGKIYSVFLWIQPVLLSILT